MLQAWNTLGYPDASGQKPGQGLYEAQFPNSSFFVCLGIAFQGVIANPKLDIFLLTAVAGCFLAPQPPPLDMVSALSQQQAPALCQAHSVGLLLLSNLSQPNVFFLP